MEPSLKGLLSEKLRLFCIYCTFHGTYYLPRGRGACLAWGVIMGAGVALWIALSGMLWHKYSTDPTVTVVESTYYQSDQTPFPAVMICDPNPVYGLKTKNVSNILRNQGYKDTEIAEFYDSFVDIHTPSYVIPTYIKDMHSLLHNMGLTMEAQLEMFKKPCNITLVSCRWRSKEYKCTDMFYEAVTTVGHCCRFDMTFFRRNAPVNTTLKPGFNAAEGLAVTVNGIKSFPNGTFKDGAVLLYIFDTAQSITMMDRPIPMLDTHFYDVDIEVYVIDSSPEVKALPFKSRKCSIESDEGIGARPYKTCTAILLMRKVVNYCKCLPFKYSAGFLSVEKYPTCTFEQYLCIYSKLEKYLADMTSVMDMDDCFQRCDYVEYNPTSEFIRRVINNKNSTFTEFTIAYASSTCLKYRREVIYTWDQMLANLGGIFGLCLGGSIISIFEILWCLIDVLVTMYNFKKKPREKETTKSQIFVIEKHIAENNEKSKERNKFLN